MDMDMDCELELPREPMVEGWIEGSLPSCSWYQCPPPVLLLLLRPLLLRLLPLLRLSLQGRWQGQWHMWNGAHVT
jgi:hypothetical protein